MILCPDNTAAGQAEVSNSTSPRYRTGDRPFTDLSVRSTPSAAACRRLIIVGVLITTVALLHWLTPTSSTRVHAVHIVLRKLFVLPIILAAIWFGLRCSLLAALGITAAYLPHIFLAWSGRTSENISQIGEIVMFWTIGGLAGWLVDREHAALREAVHVSRGALHALVAALDAREHQTERHSQRVADLACRIGERMGLQARQVLRLAQAAVLHDVGKIGVADSVLHKPGGLDEVEKAQMRQHAEKGYRILSAAPHLHGVAKLVYAHHEWYDGTGYPRGLQGDQIPLEARIFAVADVFDALTSDRPYRRAMNRDEALRIIQEQRGRHFDPAVVRVFLAVLRERMPPADQKGQPAN